MAIVAAIKGRTQSKVAMRKVMDYVAQEKKTMFHDPDTGQNYRLISGQNCVAETAYQEFMATKLQYGKDHGVFYKQFVQSFKPGEAATPQQIHMMGIELASYFKGFEVLVANHIDDSVIIGLNQRTPVITMGSPVQSNLSFLLFTGQSANLRRNGDDGHPGFGFQLDPSG